MPSLKDRMLPSLEGFSGADKSPSSVAPEVGRGPNPYIRCPLPPLNVGVDTLRQFDEGGSIPTRRVLPLPIQTVAGGGTTIKQNTTIIQQGTSGSSGSSGALALAQVTLNIPALAPNAGYKATATMAKAFQLLQLFTTQSVEVRLYSSSSAQGADIGRAFGGMVPYETAGGLITDVVLDTPPYQWSWQNRVAANADPTLSSNIYVTIINPAAVGISASTVTISYLILEA